MIPRPQWCAGGRQHGGAETADRLSGGGGGGGRNERPMLVRSSIVKRERPGPPAQEHRPAPERAL